GPLLTEADVHEPALHLATDSDIDGGPGSNGHGRNRMTGTEQLLADTVRSLSRIDPATLDPDTASSYPPPSALVLASRNAENARDNIRARALAEKARELTAHVEATTTKAPLLERLGKSIAAPR